ncbi:MAG: formate dehydrogenase subunit gamma [Thalassovita sp.]|nr:formate dehydrogenase subunit gamma [Thalassovita sp.]
MTHYIQKILALAGVLILAIGTITAAFADTATDPRAATGGAQTLQDILARQQGLHIDDSFRSGAVGDPSRAAPMTGQLGTLGGVSDAEFWRSYRYGSADIISSSRAPAADIVIQDSGMTWLKFRAGPLRTYGGYLLVAMIGILALFYLVRGRIRIDGEHAGTTILRFSTIERFAHWLLAGSFILLAITGLTLLFGRVALIPLFGHEIYSPFAIAGKWVHNNVSWAFMAALVMVTVFWIAHNIPNRHDLKWIAVAGGLFSKGVHPPARKFNAGQKLIFWSVVVLGLSISASGLSLLFPFELPMFAPTFAKVNALGLPGLLGMAPLPTELMPHQEMQLAQVWHAIVAFLFIAIILGHIYIGSLGMEGAFDAMGSGEVDEQWAKEHHGLWYEEVTGKPAHASEQHPAE